ncbi:MAG: DUF424 domain-containing protein [Candidatus Methanomethylophilaceae archaeon]
MICIKIHRGSDGRTVLAACDEELVGGSFSEGKLRLRVHESFYKGDVIEDERLAEIMGEHDIMNLVGERTVSIAAAEGYVNDGCTVTIGGVVHAQVVR